MSWDERLLEAKGVPPDIEASQDATGLRAGRDVPLEHAIRAISL